MTKEHEKIIELITQKLNQDPELRFGQALFNLGIIGFKNPTDPAKENFGLRDIHGDSDQSIIDRINKAISK